MSFSLHKYLAVLSAQMADMLGTTDVNVYYLAAPYSHTDSAVRNQRWETVTKAAAKLVESGKTVISPITMSHPIQAQCSKPQPYEYRHVRQLCEALMDVSTMMIRLKVDGTDESVGVTAETAYMANQGKPVFDMYLHDDHFRLVYTDGPKP